MKEKHIKQDFWIRGELIIVEDVPAGIYHQCGNKVVKAEFDSINSFSGSELLINYFFLRSANWVKFTNKQCLPPTPFTLPPDLMTAFATSLSPDN